MVRVIRPTPWQAHVDWAMRGVLVTVALLTTLPAAAQSVGSEPVARWERLASVTIRGPALLAASPDASVIDRVLLMVGYDGGLSRSSDGGRTWDALPAVSFGVKSLVLAPRLERLQLAFATDTNAVYRSVDAGTSWRQVLHADGSESAFHVVLSPAFATDGSVFATGVGRLWRSSDWGATWEELAPAAGQVVNQVVLSPDFARDRTLFVAAASSPLPVPGQSWPREAPDASMGIAISNDGGDSWQPAGDGLEVDGAAFRQLNQLTPSPTFATDGVLFAFAGGPWVEVVAPYPGASIPSQRGALLRSQDRGASWAVVYDTAAAQFEPHLALSPHFARDGVGVMALRRGGYSPSSSGCRVLRTGDGGESWTTQLEPSTYEGCGENAFSVLLAGKPAFFVQKGPYWEWRQSTDDGLSWRYLQPPAPNHPLVAAVATAPAGQRDSVVFGVTQFDPQYVWAYGAFGACAQRPILGFGSVWNQDEAAREQLGCARAAEHPVRVRVREHLADAASAPDRDYWPEDDTPSWWRVNRFGGVHAHAKAEEPWTDPPLRVLDGAIQPFENGSMLFVRESDGSEQILTLIGSS